MGLKPDTECRECFRRGFTDYVTRAGLSTGNYDEFIRLVDGNLDRDCPPPIAGADSWALLRRISLTGSDIFLEEKRDFTRKMLSVYPRDKGPVHERSGTGETGPWSRHLVQPAGCGPGKAPP